MKTILRYALPTLSLAVVTAGFFLLRKGRASAMASDKLQTGLQAVSALPLLASGTLHLFKPEAFVPLLWTWVPNRPLVIILTGLPELAGAIGLFFPKTRKPASLCLAIFMVAIFPANVHVAGQKIGSLAMPSVPVRWTMQAAYIVLLLVTGWGVPRAGRTLPPGEPS